MIISLFSAEKHIKHDDNVFKLVDGAVETPRMKKYRFHTDIFISLRRIIKEGSLRVSTWTDDVFQAVKDPTNIMELCSLFDFPNACKLYMPTIGCGAAPVIKYLFLNQTNKNKTKL